MSNYWRLRCLTCGEDSPATWNNEGIFVKSLARQFGALSAQMGLLLAACAAVEGPLDLLLLSAGGESLDPHWVEAHHGHDVRAADEYGRVFALDGELDLAVMSPEAVAWERRQR